MRNKEPRAKLESVQAELETTQRTLRRVVLAKDALSIQVDRLQNPKTETAEKKTVVMFGKMFPNSEVIEYTRGYSREGTTLVTIKFLDAQGNLHCEENLRGWHPKVYSPEDAKDIGVTTSLGTTRVPQVIITDTDDYHIVYQTLDGARYRFNRKEVISEVTLPRLEQK